MESNNTNTKTKTIAFFGASGGCGFHALSRSLAAGHSCIALCRKPEKLTSKFPASQYPNLRIVRGDGLDVEAVKQCLIITTTSSEEVILVDEILFSIGAAFDFKTFTIDQPTVCQDAMGTLIRALSSFSSSSSPTRRPRIMAISTTGISDSGRDVPLLFVPLYHLMLREPHKDKRAMEEQLRGSGERFTIVRPSLLVDTCETEKLIRVGVDDPSKGGFVDGKKELGYTITRNEVGRWIFQELIQGGGVGGKEEEKKKDDYYEGKMVSLTW